MNKVYPTVNDKKEIKKFKKKILCFILFCIISSITFLIFLYNIIEE